MVMPILALLVSVASALLTLWYVVETRTLRRDTARLSEQQLIEARRSAEAAQRSATAAEQQLLQTQAASEASDRSAKAAETSAKAAEESARTAAQGIQISQRAYLAAIKIEFVSSIPSVSQNLVVRS